MNFLQKIRYKLWRWCGHPTPGEIAQYWYRDDLEKIIKK